MTDEQPTSAPSFEERILKLEEELKETKEKYLRALAEIDNSRKRSQKEKLEAVRFSVENVLAEVLTPLDNLENALGFADKADEATQKWAIGFQMILTQFKDILAGHGLTSFHSIGAEFDPYLHQAVEIEETDEKPEGTILKEFVRGYRCGDRTVRPARVKVAKAKANNQGNQDE